MTPQHETANLLRRGNIVYWRPRLPNAFRDGAAHHLSLSLRQSDHMKASYMARRLNRLLHDLRLGPGARLITKEQLNALFRTEVDRMSEHLDNLQFAARRTGTDPMLAIRADVEVGWAYRLIELFGTMRQLSFEEDCPGRQVLERAGIPAQDIATIAETFLGEQRACRQPGFQAALLADMDRHGLTDTLINRERATAELMRARADMLLSSPSRYHEAQNLGLRTLLTGEPEAPQTMPSAITSEPQPSAEAVAVREPDASPEETTQPAVATAAQGASTRPILPLSEFKERCELLIKSKRTWEEKTKQDVRVMIRMLVGILEEHGVQHSGQITQFHIGKLRDHFDQVPPRYGQSARLRALSTGNCARRPPGWPTSRKRVAKNPPQSGSERTRSASTSPTSPSS